MQVIAGLDLCCLEPLHDWRNNSFLIMEEQRNDDDERNRKRGRDIPATQSQAEIIPGSAAAAAAADCALEHSLKKVRISKQYPGGIRLQQDVAECSVRARELGVDMIKIDPKNPLHLMLRLSLHREFIVSVGRYYPHHSPIITLPNGQKVDLPILNQWMPINTISDIISQLNDRNNQEHDMTDYK